MVSSAIATRYNYSVQGDLYMQAAWRRIKAGLYALAAPQQKAPRQTAPREAAPREADLRQAAPRAKPAGRAPAKRPVQAAAKPPRARASNSAAAANTRRGAVAATIPQKKAPANQLAARQTPARPPITRQNPVRQPAARRPDARALPSLAAARRQPQRKLVRAPAPAPLRREKPVRDAVPELKAAGSISDQIKRLSGRAYDVYKEIFLSRVRSHIRAALMQGRTKSGATFGDDVNTAENIIYDFMERNYSNAYMSWDSSEHRTRIRELGFDLENLNGVIESCYRKIGK
jgi:hypothetical protein